MVQTAVSAAAPGSDAFYTVNQMIVDLKMGKFRKPLPAPRAAFQPEQRVMMEYWGKQRIGTVKEVHATTGYVRVELDLVTMHEWVHPDKLVLADDVPAVGARVNILHLSIEAEIVAVQLPGVVGGVVRYRARWWEPAAQAYRSAAFWREDFTLVSNKKAATR